MSTALVTGGTSGIGNAFVRALAAKGFDVVIVARDESRMAAIKDDLEAAHGVTIEAFPADLSDREDTLRVAARIEDPFRPVDMVVNNAGFGLSASLLDPDISIQDRAMAVMCGAVHILSGAAGRAMLVRGEGSIINVASTSAWIAKGNYSAIKMWVLRYTEGLANELFGTGIKVTALCPGWVRTEFHQRAGEGTSLPGPAWLDADRVVAECLADNEAGKIISIPSRRYRIAIGLAQVTPRWAIRWFTRLISSKRKRPRRG